MDPAIEVAMQFGEALADEDYSAAHALLTTNAREAYSPEELRRHVERMTSYRPGPIREVKVMDEFILYDWPSKEEGDMAYVYVSLAGDNFLEAVSVTLANEGGVVRICDIVWGRP